MRKILLTLPIGLMAAVCSFAQISAYDQQPMTKDRNAQHFQDQQPMTNDGNAQHFHDQQPTTEMRSISQTTDQKKKPKLSHYTLAAGVGWSHYFANMDLVPARNVQKDFIGTSFRFMWEPEYRLSLGLETGFYRIFKVDSTLGGQYDMMSRMNVVPLFLVVRMKIVDNFYLSVAPGLAIQYSKITGIGPEITSKQFSMANFLICASYLYPLSERFILGAEARAMYFGKTHDYMLGLNAVFAVRF